MNGKKAGILFLFVCIVITLLLVTKAINPFTSGIIFAIALVVLGGISRGFRKI